MIEKFTFPQPDGTVFTFSVPDIVERGNGVFAFRDYGVTIAEKFPKTCTYIANAVNAIYHEHFDDDDDYIDMEKCVERIGIRLGLCIYRHLLHGEDHGDIWGDTADFFTFRATGEDPGFHIFIIRSPDEPD